ncbi:MAG: thiamine phosphate synthase, partial [Pseudohongiellaceae bacterium]
SPSAASSRLPASRGRLALPVVAIGGINADNGRSLIAAGADMLAVIQGLFGTEDVTTSAAGLVALFSTPTPQTTPHRKLHES